MENRLLSMKAKTEALALLTEAVRVFNIEAIADCMMLLKRMNVPSNEVNGAISLGRTKASLGL